MTVSQPSSPPLTDPKRAAALPSATKAKGGGAASTAKSAQRAKPAPAAKSSATAKVNGHKTSASKKPSSGGVGASPRPSTLVRRYLEHLEAGANGRHQNPDTLARRLRRVDEQLESAPVLARLALYQQHIDLTAALAAVGPDQGPALEDDFVEHALDYSSANRISYAAWRRMGVPPAVLRRAGLSRGDSHL